MQNHAEIRYQAQVATIIHQDGLDLPTFHQKDLIWLLEPTLKGGSGGDASLCVGLSISVHDNAYPDVMALSHEKRLILLQCPSDLIANSSDTESFGAGFALLKELLLCTSNLVDQGEEIDILRDTEYEGSTIQIASLSASEHACLLYHFFNLHSSFLDLELIAPPMGCRKLPPFDSTALLTKALGKRAGEVFEMTPSHFKVKSGNDTLNNEFLAGLIMTIRLSMASHRVAKEFSRICESNRDDGVNVIKSGIIATKRIPESIVDYITRFEMVEVALTLAKPKSSQTRLKKATSASCGSSSEIEYQVSKNGKEFSVTNELYKSKLDRSTRQMLEVSLTDKHGQTEKFQAKTMSSEGKKSSLRFVGEGGLKAMTKLKEGAVISESRLVLTTAVDHIDVRGREDHSLAEVDGMLWRRQTMCAPQDPSQKYKDEIDGSRLLSPFLLGEDHHAVEEVLSQSIIDLMARPEMQKYDKIARREARGVLNESQARAARSIMSPLDGLHVPSKVNHKNGHTIKRKDKNNTEILSDRLILIHGPPGTGKTSLITACCEQWEASCASEEIITEGGRNAIYACCQSNVAVKNIAESFSRAGINFKIIVSANFYVDWHEDLYEDIRSRLIRSDELPNTPDKLRRVLDDCSVILSTIAFLSSPKAIDNGACSLLTLRPMRLLFVDEASQIHLRAYPQLLHRFARNIARIVFLGDDCQLPPFQGEDIVDAGLSVFQLVHLRERAFLLDTCYRLAKPMAEFISENVYDGKVKCGQSNFNPEGGLLDCAGFVDVASSSEEKYGTSRLNRGEVSAVVRLVEEYVKRGGSMKQLKVLTTYDAQRDALEDALRAKDLSGASDVVFSVDSFQGRESEYIILSLVKDGRLKQQQVRRNVNKSGIVRFLQPGLGFLSSDRRMNVALTRAKRGIVVVSNRRFVNVTAAETLVGKMQVEMQFSGEGGEEHWSSEEDLMNNRMPRALFNSLPKKSSGKKGSSKKVEEIVGDIASKLQAQLQVADPSMWD